VLRILKDRREGCIAYMSAGNLKSMEHYRELMSNLECLTHVEQELKGLLEKQERYDD
tara:strand:+ start:95 stop:265 length:171 start_codon:yes stop_codon:yes gene_type:complete